jgi:hypothetical protein
VYDITFSVAKYNWEFAKESDSASYYSENRGTSQEKAISDIFVGKLGEHGASIFLNEQCNVPIMLPDYSHYVVGDKSWSADFNFYSKHGYFEDIHVKSTSKFRRDYMKDIDLQESWTFQFSNTYGSGGKDELFNSGGEHDYVLLTQVVYDTVDSRWNNKVRIYGLIPWNLVKPLLRDPKLEQYIGKKKCLYWSDVVDKYGGKKV